MVVEQEGSILSFLPQLDASAQTGREREKALDFTLVSSSSFLMDLMGSQ